jgi:hypothetical protein
LAVVCTGKMSWECASIAWPLVSNLRVGVEVEAVSLDQVADVEESASAGASTPDARNATTRQRSRTGLEARRSDVLMVPQIRIRADVDPLSRARTPMHREGGSRVAERFQNLRSQSTEMAGSGRLG